MNFTIMDFIRPIQLTIFVMLLTVAFPALGGITLDESVISQCEQEHPNSTIGQLLCNNRLDNQIQAEKARIEAENAKQLAIQNAIACNLNAISTIKNEKSKFDTFLNENANENVSTVIANLKQIGFSAEMWKDHGEGNAEVKNESIFFKRTTNCNSRRIFLFNIRFNDQGKTETFHAWNIDPDNRASFISIPELTWERKNNLSAIASAPMLKEIARKKREEEVRKQEAEQKIRETEQKIRETEQKIKEAADAAQQRKNLRLYTGCFLGFALAIGLVLMADKRLSKPSKSVGDNLPSPAQLAYSRSEAAKPPDEEEYQPLNPKNPDAPLPEPNKTSKSNRKHPEYTYSDYTNSFKEKYPFVSINVLPSVQDQFIQECLWLQKRTGHFPSIDDQQNILDSIKSTNG